MDSAKKDLVLIGAGGHSKDLTYLALEDKYKLWNLIGYIDDNKLIDGLLGSVETLPDLMKRYNNLYYSIAINSSMIRKKIFNTYGLLDRSANLIHYTAVIGSECEYDNGLTMGPYSVLTTRVRIGKHVHINTGASINQSSTIGDYCTISPGARICGDVNVGENTSIGAGAVIINFKDIGDNCTLGAGTVVINHVMNGSTVVGVPGKVIK